MIETPDSLSVPEYLCNFIRRVDSLGGSLSTEHLCSALFLSSNSVDTYFKRLGEALFPEDATSRAAGGRCPRRTRHEILERARAFAIDRQRPDRPP